MEYPGRHARRSRILAAGSDRWCQAIELPTWLAAVAKKLRIAWDTPFISSNVRGTKRDQIARWLVPA